MRLAAISLFAAVCTTAGATTASRQAAAAAEQRPRSMALSADASTLAVVEADGAVRVWDARRGRLLRELPGSRYSTATPSPDGRYLAHSDSTGLRGHNLLWDVTTGEQLWKQPSAGTSRFHFTAGGERLLVVTAIPTRRARYNLETLDVKSGKPGPLRAAQWDTPTYALSPDGSLLALYERDRAQETAAVLIHDVRSGEVRARLERMPPVVRLALASGGKRLAVADSTGTLTLWNVPEGRPERTLAEPPRVGLASVVNFTFSPSGRLVVAAGEVGGRDPERQRLRVWDGVSGDALPPLAQGAGTGPVFSPDESRLAARSPEGALRLWNPRTGELIRTFEAAPLETRFQTVQETWHRFTPDGRSLVAAGEPELRRWEVRSGHLEHSFRVERRPAAAPTEQ